MHLDFEYIFSRLVHNNSDHFVRQHYVYHVSYFHEPMHILSLPPTAADCSESTNPICMSIVRLLLGGTPRSQIQTTWHLLGINFSSDSLQSLPQIIKQPHGAINRLLISPITSRARALNTGGDSTIEASRDRESHLYPARNHITHYQRHPSALKARQINRPPQNPCTTIL